MPGYVFQSVWALAADPDRVFAALADASAYPGWWPQVRSARQLDALTGEVRCRTLAPRDIVFRVHRIVEDPSAHVLSARLEGDLLGLTTWTLAPAGTGTRAVFDEQLDLRPGLVRGPIRLIRPLLRINHDALMRSGEAGLRRYLSEPSGDAD